MCRHRPGPRCSNAGRIRYSKALENYLRRKKQFINEVKSSKTQKPGYRINRQFRTAEQRLIAAERVFDSTNLGQKEIEQLIKKKTRKIKQIQDKPYLSRTQEEQKKLIVNREISRRLGYRLEKGKSRRTESNQDLQEFGSMRRYLRDISRMAGGEQGARGKYVNDVNELARLIAYTQSTSVQERVKYKADDFYTPVDKEKAKRAKTWVEGTSIFINNKNVRPPKSIAGKSISQQKVKDSKSCFTRMNMPDGTVVEGRKDIHLTGDENSYYVTMRLSSVSSWEDVSPIDVTQQPMGHLFKDSASANGKPLNIRDRTSVKVFSNLNSAEKYLKEIEKQQFSQDDLSAMAVSASHSIEQRISKELRLQQRGNITTQRYNDLPRTPVSD